MHGQAAALYNRCLLRAPSLRCKMDQTDLLLCCSGAHISSTTIAFSVLQDSSTVDALNHTDLPRRFSEARISSFQIEADLVVTPRLFYVYGEALERFAQMTNWDYYEAVSRFQKVLDAAGEAAAWALNTSALG